MPRLTSTPVPLPNTRPLDDLYSPLPRHTEEAEESSASASLLSFPRSLMTPPPSCYSSAPSLESHTKSRGRADTTIPYYHNDCVFVTKGVDEDCDSKLRLPLANTTGYTLHVGNYADSCRLHQLEPIITCNPEGDWFCPQCSVQHPQYIRAFPIRQSSYS